MTKTYDTPDVTVTELEVGASFQAPYEDEEYRYDGLWSYKNQGGKLTIATRLRNTDEFGWPQTCHIIVSAVDVFASGNP